MCVLSDITVLHVSGSNNLASSLDWLQNLDTFKENVRLAGSYKWEDYDLSQIGGNTSIQGQHDTFVNM